MNFFVRRITSDEWRTHLSKDAHLIAFGEDQPPEVERIDFALIAIDSKDQYSGFITCRETDAKSLYWQYGGPMPQYRKTIHVVRILRAGLSWATERYDRVRFKVYNTNTAMMKMAMHWGFLITGVTYFKGKILVELTKEFYPEVRV